MKTILVATDFSPAADNALLFALNMAKGTGARIVLFNAYLAASFVPDMVLIVPDKDLYDEQFAMLQRQVSALSSVERAMIELRCEPGNAAEKIITTATEVNPSWIIAGVKKSGKTIRKIFGSTALTLVRHSSTPLIIVPEAISFLPIDTIALASDLTTEHNLHMLDPLIEFGSAFHTAIYIVNVIKRHSYEDISKAYEAFNLKWTMKQLSPSIEFLKEEDIGDALNHFIETHKISMLAMIAHPHSLIERLFSKSSIKEMMFETHLPLMILPDKDQKVVGEEHTSAGASKV